VDAICQMRRLFIASRDHPIPMQDSQRVRPLKAMSPRSPSKTPEASNTRKAVMSKKNR
jgi:hypothetical protein